MKAPGEALRMTAHRRLEHVYYVAKEDPRGELIPYELPEDAFHRHAMMPIL